MTVDRQLSKDDRNELIDSITLANSAFSSVIMRVLAKYQVLSDEDILILTNKEQCRTLFQSDYPMLKKINSDLSIRSQVVDTNNHSRFYSEVYNLNDKQYVMTSQLYGLSTSGTHRNNRTPFYNWILTKFEISDDWLPSLSDYNPGIGKEQWIEILKDNDFIDISQKNVLAMFYTEPYGATCKFLGDEFNRDPFSISGICTGLAKHIQKVTNCTIITDEDGSKKYWPILFFGKSAGNDMPGQFVWKLRPELYDALKEYQILKYLPVLPKNAVIWKISHGGSETPPYRDKWLKENKVVVAEDTKAMAASKTTQGESFKNEIKQGHYVSISHGSQIVRLGRINNDIYNINNDLNWLERSYDTVRDSIINEPYSGQSAWWTPNFNSTCCKVDNNSQYEKLVAVPYFNIKFADSKGGEASMTTKQMLDEIKKYIAARGFTYEGSLIENFYLSLKSKPFVILAGTSGTGKTKLAEYFAEAVGGKKELVPVRPDWSDSSDLFGHVNLKGEFTTGAIIDFIKEANENKGKPYFLIFDEMNLARVEYYMSDFLSVLETRRRSETNNEIITAPLFKDSILGNDDSALKKYSGLTIPDNLYIIGTVNMDETTFPFSKKVLDRANTIEFSYVDLSPVFEDYGSVEKPIPVQNDFMKPSFIRLQECSDHKDTVQKTCDELVRINDKLKAADLHVGYRIRDDFCFYMINREMADILSFDEAFDNQIMQKILPRIQGSSSSVKEVIQELFKICAGDYTGMADNGSINESMKHFIETKRDQCKYYKSAEKLVYMMRRYEEDGFTSYWL